MILEAANYNPLLAQQMEEELTPVWWERYLLDRHWRIKAMEQKSGE